MNPHKFRRLQELPSLYQTKRKEKLERGSVSAGLVVPWFAELGPPNSLAARSTADPLLFHHRIAHEPRTIEN